MFQITQSLDKLGPNNWESTVVSFKHYILQTIQLLDSTSTGLQVLVPTGITDKATLPFAASSLSKDYLSSALSCNLTQTGVHESILFTEESVFAPKDIDLESGEMDDAERELEAFKRFCLQSVPPQRKEKVHLNIKDIVLKKKSSAISCS